MNAVEIEEGISALAELPFDASEFSFAFLQAFGNEDTTIKRLGTGASNRSDLAAFCKPTISTSPFARRARLRRPWPR